MPVLTNQHFSKYLTSENKILSMHTFYQIKVPQVREAHLPAVDPGVQELGEGSRLALTPGPLGSPWLGPRELLGRPGSGGEDAVN